MACTYNLYTELGATSNFGTWAATSWPGSPGTGTWNPANNPSNGWDLGGAGPTNDTFNPTGQPAGTYVFTYTVTTGTCTDTAAITFTVVAPPDTGADITLNQCTSDTTPINLYTALGATDNTGTWSGTPSAAWAVGTGSPTDDTFTPSLATPGTYEYTYTVTTPGTDPSCTNCTSFNKVTIVVVAVPNAGTPVTLTVCS